jgi:hypothetical protein
VNLTLPDLIYSIAWSIDLLVAVLSAASKAKKTTLASPVDSNSITTRLVFGSISSNVDFTIQNSVEELVIGMPGAPPIIVV